MYKTGLIVGKFCPLHKGHEHLIETALTVCENLIILSYTSEVFENCTFSQRQNWLRALYPQATHQVIDTLWVSAQGSEKWTALPADDAPEIEHRLFCSWVCFDILKQTPDAIFTSEDYGDGFAAIIQDYATQKLGKPHRVEHICVDKARDTVPISGTAIRENPFKHRAYLHPLIYKDFVKRVLILGGESTGKSTLCAALADRAKTHYVPEYGRTLWEAKGGALAYEDVLKIAKTQLEHEAIKTAYADTYLFCDTSPLTTLFYSEALFGKVDPLLEELSHTSYDYVFLCDDDFDFVQDGTRQDEAFREKQQGWYKKTLKAQGINYILLSGPIDARIAKALSVIRA